MKPLKPKYKWKSRPFIDFYLGTMPLKEQSVIAGSRLAYNEMNDYYSREEVLLLMFEIGDRTVAFMPDPFSRRNLLVDLSLTSLAP